jgi:hypothetical protein
MFFGSIALLRLNDWVSMVTSRRAYTSEWRPSANIAMSYSRSHFQPIVWVIAGLLGFQTFIAAALGQSVPPPPGRSPQLWLAEALKEDGKVVIQIFESTPVASNPKNGPGADMIVWRKLKRVILDETVQAFNVDGKRAKAEQVLATLGKPSGVAVIVRVYPVDRAEPPAFYSNLLRPGTLVLIVKGEDIADPVP